MANFPASLDVLPTVAADTKEDDTGVPHDELHNLLARAIEAIEARVGVTDSGDPDSIEYRLRAVAGAGSFAPFEILADETFVVPARKQVLFTLPIDLVGLLDISGALVEIP